MRKLRERVRKLRRKLPPLEVENYALTDLAGKPVHLSRLFGRFDELLLIHNMGPQCAYCTLWADGISSFVPYFRDRCALALETDIPAKKLRAFARSRGWRFAAVSSLGSSLKQDLGVKSARGNQPAISSFFREHGKIYRHALEPLGPGDDFCSFWSMIDLLPNRERAVKVHFQK